MGALGLRENSSFGRNRRFDHRQRSCPRGSKAHSEIRDRDHFGGSVRSGVRFWLAVSIASFLTFEGRRNTTTPTATSSCHFFLAPKKAERKISTFQAFLFRLPNNPKRLNVSELELPP